VSLTVTPYIGEGGEITLVLEPEVSDVITDDTKPQTINGATGSAMPVITRRHAKTSIQIKDGQTVFLGGLIRERHRATTSKVPLAGDIPGLGAAFRNIHDQKEQQEVVILITANIVDNRKPKFETVAPRLEKRYVSPLDAISTTP
jgi:general secretion pathway protein D